MLCWEVISASPPLLTKSPNLHAGRRPHLSGLVMGLAHGRGSWLTAYVAALCMCMGLASYVRPPATALAWLGIAMAAAALGWTRRRPVYLVDFSCFKPGVIHRRSREYLYQQASLSNKFNEKSLTFMMRMLERSGIGQETYVPLSMLKIPQMPHVQDAIDEFKQEAFGAIDELLGKSGVRVEDIGILVVNCSLFGTVPSLSAMIVNHYKLNENILSHHLGGMGCSAGLISIDLAKRLLQVHRNTCALVVSTENLSLSCYFGNNRAMLVTNSLFRMGCGAVLLSNRRCDRRRSKYELVHVVRTHKGTEDRSYGCVTQEEDDDGYVGVNLSKDLMAVAGEALKSNITTLGPLVLPLSEKLRFLWSMLQRKALKMNVKPYMPDFKLAFEHFCIHAGGRAVLDEIEKRMSLTDRHMEPSRMTLWRWGNTSSSSLWYELAYIEAKGRVRKGDRLWQIAFGSGFKCNSAVWRATRDVVPAEEKNPWMEEIDRFPVEVPKVTALSN